MGQSGVEPQEVCEQQIEVYVYNADSSASKIGEVVKIANLDGIVLYTQKTNSIGKAYFSLPRGVYEIVVPSMFSNKTRVTIPASPGDREFSIGC